MEGRSWFGLGANCPTLGTDDVVRLWAAAKCWNEGRRYEKLVKYSFNYYTVTPSRSTGTTVRRDTNCAR